MQENINDAVKQLAAIEEVISELPDAVSEGDGELPIATDKAVIKRQIEPLRVSLIKLAKVVG